MNRYANQGTYVYVIDYSIQAVVVEPMRMTCNLNAKWIKTVLIHLIKINELLSQSSNGVRQGSIVKSVLFLHNTSNLPIST
jgi:hypothetical protein